MGAACAKLVAMLRGDPQEPSSPELESPPPAPPPTPQEQYRATLALLEQLNVRQ